MALSIRLVAPNYTRSALHNSIKSDSAHDKVIKKLFGLLMIRNRCAWDVLRCHR